MRLIIIVVVALASLTSAVEVIGSGGYHQDVGIPLAAKIKEREDKMMAAFDGNQPSDRIIGGVLAPSNRHPYFAGLLIDMTNFPGQSVCGATVLSPNRLVTAAHCWTDGRIQAWRFNVVLGTTQLYWGGVRIQTTNVIMHPQYTWWNLHNDIAMAYLPINIGFSAAIQPVAIPSIADQWTTFAGAVANAVGFGTVSDSQAAASTILSHVNLMVLSHQQCLSIVPNWAAFVNEGTLCTSGQGGVGVCSGDSGGPLVTQRNGQNILIGVASFAASNACEQGWPSGFVRVTRFLNFINQHLH